MRELLNVVVGEVVSEGVFGCVVEILPVDEGNSSLDSGFDDYDVRPSSHKTNNPARGLFGMSIGEQFQLLD